MDAGVFERPAVAEDAFVFIFLKNLNRAKTVKTSDDRRTIVLGKTACSPLPESRNRFSWTERSEEFIHYV
jgi:hypothetical protein